MRDLVRRVPGVLPLWRLCKRIPGVERLRHDLRLWRMYGRRRPTRIELDPPSEGTIFVDPLEPRGLALLLCRASGQGPLKALWRTARDVLTPAVALDVGLNYGEVLFGTHYAEQTRLIGIEAADELMPWLRQTADAHASADRVELHHALADELPGEGQFFYDPRWSGRSSAVAMEGGAPARSVPRVVVDDLLDAAPDGPLLFKIDVEGFEPRVLRGMQRSLGSRPYIGLIEISTRRWRSAIEAEAGDAAIDAVLAPLAPLAVLTREGPQQLPAPTLAAMRSALGAEPDAEIEGDLLLASDEEMLGALLDRAV